MVQAWTFGTACEGQFSARGHPGLAGIPAWSARGDFRPIARRKVGVGYALHAAAELLLQRVPRLEKAHQVDLLRGDVQLPANIAAVGIDGIWRDVLYLGDLLGALATAQQLAYTEFAGAETGEPACQLVHVWRCDFGEVSLKLIKLGAGGRRCFFFKEQQRGQQDRLDSLGHEALALAFFLLDRVQNHFQGDGLLFQGQVRRLEFGVSALGLMNGRQKSYACSWVVAAANADDSKRGWPTGYTVNQIDPDCYRQICGGADNIIEDAKDLKQWLGSDSVS